MLAFIVIAGAAALFAHIFLSDGDAGLLSFGVFPPAWLVLTRSPLPRSALLGLSTNQLRVLLALQGILHAEIEDAAELADFVAAVQASRLTVQRAQPAAGRQPPSSRSLRSNPVASDPPAPSAPPCSPPKLSPLSSFRRRSLGRSSSSSSRRNQETRAMECAICYEAMGGELLRRMATAHCGHLYCKDCWVRQVRQAGRCPACGVAVSEAQVIPLFL